MIRRGHFDDPLDDIDPVMEQAYSVNDNEDEELPIDTDQASDPDPIPNPDPDNLMPDITPAAPVAEEPTFVNEEPTFEERIPAAEIKKTHQEPMYEDDFSTYKEKSSMPTISDIEFPNLSESDAGKKVELDVFKNIPVNLSVELGRAKISLKEVFELTEGSIIELERLVGEPLDLVVNGQLVAQGEVVAIDNNYGLRVTNIVSKPQK